MDGITLTRHPVGIGGVVAEIMLDRPPVNAVNSELAHSIAQVCAELAAESTVRAVVLCGAPGPAFCAGADLKERAGMSDADIMRQRPAIRAMFGAVLALPQPAIAAVHGFALGGGCELALSCDLIVADETAVFGLPEVTVGLVPGGGGTQLALRRLGAGRAADLVLTGRKITIDEAERLGIVDRRVASGTAAGGTAAAGTAAAGTAAAGAAAGGTAAGGDRAGRNGAGKGRGEAVRAAALELAEQIAANSPVAVRAAKRALRNGWGTGMAAGLDIEDAAWRTAALSADRREGIAAFAEKRPPSWPAE
jgi:enoyl-CoA hydratase/carnithine racemase